MYGDDEALGRQISLAELTRSKTRDAREEIEMQEEIEEQKQLEAAQNDIKQHFIDIKTGKQYDPDKRFGVIEDGT